MTHAPKGTLTPESAMIFALWYSWRLRHRTGPTDAAAADDGVAAAGRARRRSTLAAVDVSIVLNVSRVEGGVVVCAGAETSLFDSSSGRVSASSSAGVMRPF